MRVIIVSSRRSDLHQMDLRSGLIQKSLEGADLSEVSVAGCWLGMERDENINAMNMFI